MHLRFQIYPPGDELGYYCEMEVSESDLALDSEEFADRFLVPAANVLLGSFEEPWPSTADAVLAMLNRGGPTRSIKFYRERRFQAHA